MDAKHYEEFMGIWAAEEKHKFYGNAKCYVCEWHYESSEIFGNADDAKQKVSIIAKAHFSAKHCGKTDKSEKDSN